MDVCREAVGGLAHQGYCPAIALLAWLNAEDALMAGNSQLARFVYVDACEV